MRSGQKICRSPGVVRAGNDVVDEVRVCAADADVAARDQGHNLAQQGVLEVDPRRVCAVRRQVGRIAHERVVEREGHVLGRDAAQWS